MGQYFRQTYSPAYFYTLCISDNGATIVTLCYYCHCPDMQDCHQVLVEGQY